MPEQQIRYELDSNARRGSNRTALFGGSPFRLMRLSARGRELLDRWIAGRPVEVTEASEELRVRLVSAGLLHPVVQPVVRGDVGFVVPVHDDAQGLESAVASIRAESPDAPIVVVDDASPVPVELEGATVVRHAANSGPAAARNTGVAALPVGIDVVIFVDSDVVLERGCVGRLLAHLEDAAVTAVAPRIQAANGPSVLDRYEATESPLDLGANASIVRPGSPVPYVPSTVLAVRRAAFDATGGFDESMRVGEDVDFIWRLVDAGETVRYEPRALARHRNRESWAALARQRFGYGTAAAGLNQRHPGDVAPVEIPAPMFAAWVAISLGGPLGVLAGGALSISEAKKLHDRLGHGTDLDDTVALSLLGHRHAIRWLAHAVRRAWLPLFLLAAPFSRRARRTLLVALALPAFEASSNLDPLRRRVAGVLVDDTAYCAGLWSGVLAKRSIQSLLPRFSRSESSN